jgi:hypothetical protein
MRKIPPSVEAVARKICLSYGSDPDELASILEICTADNKPLPRWRLYEEQAEAVAELYATPPASPAAQSEAVASAWRVWWVSLNTARTELFEDRALARKKATETGGCVIPLYATPPASPARDEVIEELLAYEQALAKLSGFSDCTCMGYSREAERAYESGQCPHQKARAYLSSQGATPKDSRIP